MKQDFKKCPNCKSENWKKTYNHFNEIIYFECSDCKYVNKFGLFSKENSFKNDLGKPMMNLLPFESLEAVAMVQTYGIQTYGKNTWQKVENGLDRYEAALLRHLTAWKKGEKTDKESGLNHLAHMACNALFMLWLELQEQKNES